ncbi:MAG TPA: transcription termination/antitermination protein NusA [Armatimonadetes bacterium]|jgi:N utilization substance protein A|nr:transcription termination/antitermination protein NusA [Armatimonadota bacterium]
MVTAEFVHALRQIEKEKEIPLDKLLPTIEDALVSAYKKDYGGTGAVRVVIDQNRPSVMVFAERVVVEHVEEPANEISLDQARKQNPNAQVGDVVELEVTPDNFGRIAAQTAKQVVLQRIREAERDAVFDEYQNRIGEVMTGIVQWREGRNVFVNLGKVEALLPPKEQVAGEPYRFGDRIRVLILDVRKAAKAPMVIVSRTHPNLLRRLFEMEVPEIADQIVEIKSVAREAGARSKIAVASNDEKVDPVGACVGPRGSRVQSVVQELYNEKIDVVRWSDDIREYVRAALSPAKPSSVQITDPERKSILVIVPSSQLSLAIGREGQNVRLAARLVGWKIDIRDEARLAAEQADAQQAATEAAETGNE